MIWRILFAGINSVAFSIIFNVQRRDIIWVGLCGMLGYFVTITAGQLGYFAGTLAGSMVIAAYSEMMARMRKRPATVFLVSGLLPIIPGSGMYQSMVFGIQGDSGNAIHTAYNVFLQLGGIIIGIVFISSVLKFFRPFAPKANRQKNAPKS